MSDMKPCEECGTYFNPTHYMEKICSDECRAVRAKKRNQESIEKKKKLALERLKAKEPKPCIICGTMFTSARDNQVTCGDRKCINKNSRNAAEKQVRMPRCPTQQAAYSMRFIPPMNIDTFEYMKALRHMTARVKSRERSYTEKTARGLAARMLKMTPVMVLERAYIREVEKERLRRNIKQVLRVDKIDGEYTLEEVGKVLGVTRERARQIENDALSILKHPTSGRALKEYL